MPSSLFPDYRAAWEDDQVHDFRMHAREFMAKEVTPHQERWAANKQVDRELWNKMGEAGLLCTEIAEDLGGLGQHYGYEAVVQEELCLANDFAVGYGVASTIVPPYIDKYGTDEQKQKWLPKLASGEMVGAIAMTEPGTGSDLQAIKTTAVRDGDDYVINGSKTFITNGSLADLVIIVCKTDPEGGHAGMSLIVAEVNDLPGFERGRVLEKIGMHGQDTRELFFNDMRVPAANLLGTDEGQGFYQLMGQLGRERLIIGVTGVAGSEAAVIEALRYSKEREAFGKPILKFQNTRFVLAECKAEVLAGKTFMDYCIQLAIDDTLDPATASMAKMWATDKQGEIVDKCLQIFGGYGYMMEYPIAKAYAAARVQRIYGGTNEIMKELIGRTL
jgi:acyl-CoA dehydrogenase